MQQANNQEIETSNIHIRNNQYYVRTDRVLIQRPKQQGNQITLYCPSYMRIKVKNFTEISLQNLSASINATIKFSFQVTGIPQQVKEQLRNKIVLRFNRDQSLQLDTSKPQIVLKQGKIFQNRQLMNFTIRKTIKTGMVPDVFWTPFQNLNLILSITIQHLEIKTQSIIQQVQLSMNNRHCEYKKSMMDSSNTIKYPDLSLKETNNTQGKIVRVRFNLMNYEDDYVFINQQGDQIADMTKIGFSNQGHFGNYDLAQKLLKVQYTNQSTAQVIRSVSQNNNADCTQTLCCCCIFCYRGYKSRFHRLKKNRKDYVPKIKQQKNIKSFQYSHFQIPVYRLPFVSLLTIFLPLWLLGLISLGIFFQNNGLADRIASIATVMIAFVALVPVVRDQLPPNPRVTFVQILVYTQILISFFCLIESINVRQTDIVFNWQKNTLFLVSLSIQIFQGIAIILLSLTYCLCWLPKYNLKQGREQQLDIKKWQHMKCDNYFESIIKKQNLDIQQLNPYQKKNQVAIIDY